MARLFLPGLALVVLNAAASAQVAVLPVVGSAPETGLQYGVTALYVRRSPDVDTRPTTIQLYAIATAKHQRQLFLERDWWAPTNARRLYTRLDWIDFPQAYYGIGWTGAEVEAYEEFYRAGGASLHAILMQRVRGPLFASTSLRLIDRTVKDREPSGALAVGDVVGSAGGRVVLPFVGLTWDTRDDVFAPTRGRFVEANTGASRTGLGSDFNFSRTTFDARTYRRLGSATLALQLYAERHTGSVPFDQLSLVGGNTVMRGYVRGRFRDNALMATQAELRMPATQRLTVALFGGWGQTGPDFGDAVSAFLFSGPDGADPYITAGGGVRWRLFRDARTSVRVDLAAGSHGARGLYIALNEAF